MNQITKIRLFATLAITLFASTITAQDLPVTPAPEGAQVTIVSPKDGDVVQKEFVVMFGLSGMGVAPAGSILKALGITICL